MKKRPTLTAAAAVMLSLCGHAAADARLQYANPDGQPVADLYVRDGQVRMDRTTDAVSMLVDTRDGSMTMIDHGRRMYTVMDRSTMNQMRARMEQMRAQMQQQLAALPEQQRKMVEQQMGGMLGGAGAGPEVRETGEQRTVSGYGCRVVEGHLQGQLLFRACVTPAAAMNLPPADTATLEAFGRVMSENAAGMSGRGGPPPMALEGVPVSNTDPRTGRVETLSATELGDLDASIFAVPAGYTEQQMGGPGMGGPGMGGMMSQ